MLQEEPRMFEVTAVQADPEHPGYLIITVACRDCKKSHIHGVARDSVGHVQNRVSHCPYRRQYKDDYNFTVTQTMVDSMEHQ